MFAAPEVYRRFNRDPINQAALVHLHQLGVSPEANALHVMDLAIWGLEHDHVAVPWNRYALELAVGQILDTDPKLLMKWLVSNPNGPAAREQRAHLLNLLEQAESPDSAAAGVLEVIHSRLAANMPYLRPVPQFL